jgi:hypothetical protein
MITVHNFALVASLLAVLGGGGVTLTAAPATPTIRIIQDKQVSSALIETESSCTGRTATMAQSVSWSTSTPWTSAAPMAKGQRCKCGKCPITLPPANCQPGEKTCKTTQNCSFNIICNGAVVTCTVKVKVEFCSAQGCSR